MSGQVTDSQVIKFSDFQIVKLSLPPLQLGQAPYGCDQERFLRQPYRRYQLVLSMHERLG